jgi:hypothetical protein
MLKQLSSLSNEADGRYASEAELKFIQDYLSSFETRVNAYEKLRANEERIVNQVGAKAMAGNPKIYFFGNVDQTAICRRDRSSVLRISAAAMLMDELEHLRNGFLCWYRTIVHAFNYQGSAKITYGLLNEAVTQTLTPEELTYMRPALELNKSILTEVG